MFNCAVVIYRGAIFGIVPKTYLPNYREFYEVRQCTSGSGIRGAEIKVAGRSVPFGVDLLFQSQGTAPFTAHVEICEDVWVPQPPSTAAALAGAEILLNLSASNITIGKADARRLLCASQSARCIAAYAYSAAGPGESTTDLAWDGHAAVFEYGNKLAETERFSLEPTMAVADVDLALLRQERMRVGTFSDCIRRNREAADGFRTIVFDFEAPQGELQLMRSVDRYPFVPSDPKMLRENCYEAYNIQIQGLAKRLQAAKIEKVVIGVSGGLDFHPSADRIGSRHGSLEVAAEERAGLHAAWLCHVGSDQSECLAADACARGYAGRDRHSTGRTADARRHRPPVRPRGKHLRRHVRERAGGVADGLSIPSRQPERRLGLRNR